MVDCSSKKNWESSDCKTVYHVTTSDRAKQIMKEGLHTAHRKNVPISDKDSNYVFSDLLEAGYFASEMNWKIGKPVSVLCLKVDKSDLKQDMNTRAIVGKWHTVQKDISPGQICKVMDADKQFWDEHKARMDKVFKRGGTRKMII